MSLTARPGRALAGTAQIPGDKSGSHRALILAAMARGRSRIDNLADGADVRSTVAALRAFGVGIDREGDGAWTVEGRDWRSPEGPVDCGNSGTTARLLVGAVAGMPGVRATFLGDRSLSRRPMRRLVDPLRRMGASIEGSDTLPLAVAGTALDEIKHRNLPASAQVKSALMLAGLGTAAPVEILEPVPSRDHGEILLRQFGAEVHAEERSDGLLLSLGSKRRPHVATVSLGADPSSAAFPLVAGLIVAGSGVRVRGMLVNPHRTGLYATLAKMGGRIEFANERMLSGEWVADVTVRAGRLAACRVGAAIVPSMIDEIPVLAMACAVAEGESRIEGLAELRHKESDRLAALVEGLVACGVGASAEGDTLVVRGGHVPGGRIASRGDHRIAMAFLTLGLASGKGITVDEAGSIAVSFPGYVDVMRRLGADIG